MSCNFGRVIHNTATCHFRACLDVPNWLHDFVPTMTDQARTSKRQHNGPEISFTVRQFHIRNRKKPKKFASGQKKDSQKTEAQQADTQTSKAPKKTTKKRKADASDADAPLGYYAFGNEYVNGVNDTTEKDTKVRAISDGNGHAKAVKSDDRTAGPGFDPDLDELSWVPLTRPMLSKLKPYATIRYQEYRLSLNYQPELGPVTWVKVIEADAESATLMCQALESNRIIRDEHILRGEGCGEREVKQFTKFELSGRPTSSGQKGEESVTKGDSHDHGDHAHDSEYEQDGDHGENGKQEDHGEVLELNVDQLVSCEVVEDHVER